MVSRSSTASDTKSPKTSGKAGGQKSFEDEMRSGKKSSTSAKSANEDTSSEGDNGGDTDTLTESETTTTTSTSDSSNGNTGSEIMNDQDNELNEGSTDTASNLKDSKPEDAEFREIEGIDITGSTSVEELIAGGITVDQLMKQAGTDILSATPDQLSLANAAVQKINESSQDGTVSLDSIRATINDIVQKSDDKPAASTAIALTGRGRKAAVSQADNEPITGKVMTQRDFYRAILESDNCWAYIKFGKCIRPFKITKKEAQQVAATVMAYETPADHNMECFAEVRLGGLFIGTP